MPVRHGRENRHAARFGGPGQTDKTRVECLAEDKTLKGILVEERIRVHALLEAQDLSAQFARGNDCGVTVACDRLGLIARYDPADTTLIRRSVPGDRRARATDPRSPFPD